MRPAWVGKRRDATEVEIVYALKVAGAKVERLDRPVDLLVRYGDRVFLLECDGITKNRKREQKQLDFIALWDVPRVTTPEQALKAIGAI